MAACDSAPHFVWISKGNAGQISATVVRRGGEISKKNLQITQQLCLSLRQIKVRRLRIRMWYFGLNSAGSPFNIDGCFGRIKLRYLVALKACTGGADNLYVVSSQYKEVSGQQQPVRADGKSKLASLAGIKHRPARLKQFILIKV